MFKLIKFIIKAALTLLSLGVFCFVVLLISLVIRENTVKAPVKAPQAIIILGAQVKKDGSLSVQLADRLEAALKVHHNYPDALIIPCGGQGENEPVSEGLAMKNWLIAQGVPEALIYPETASTSTKQNIENAYTLLQTINKDSNQVYVITSDYHLPRALALAKDAGFEAEGIGSPTKREYWLKNHIRETLSWGKYYTQKYLHWPTFDI